MHVVVERADKRRFGTWSMDIAPESEEERDRLEECHAGHSGYEADDGIGSDFAPLPVLPFLGFFDDVNLPIVEDLVAVRRRDAGMRFFQGRVDLDLVLESEDRNTVILSKG